MARNTLDAGARRAAWTGPPVSSALADHAPCIAPQARTAAPPRMTTLTDEDDTALVARCVAGEAAAWTALVHRYKRLVYAVARRARLDDAAVADVFQTVFARLIEHLPRLRQPERLHAWIVTTAKREALLQRRSAERTTSLTRTDDDGEAGQGAQADVVDDAALPDEMLMELQEANRVRNALDRLDGRCRDLLMLLFGDHDGERDGDLPYDEVSRRMAMPIGSIGPTRSRCLEKLRGLLS